MTKVCTAALLMTTAAITVRADVVRGKLVDSETGLPIPSATVRVLPTGATVPVFSTESDDDGLFATPDLKPGAYGLEFSKPGYLATTARIRVPTPGGRSALTVRVEPLAVIAGLVTDTKGQPLRGSRVRAFRRRSGAPGFDRSGNDAVVDDLGRYRLFGLLHGDYAIVVSYNTAEGGAGLAVYPSGPALDSTRVLSVAAGERRENIDFTVGADMRSAIAGTVQPQAGRFRVSVMARGFPDVVLASQEVDSGKEFKLEGLAPGSYEVAAAGPAVGFTEAGAVLADRPLYGRVQVEIAGDTTERVVIPVDEGKSAVFRLRVERDPAGRCPQTAWVRMRPTVATAAFLPQAALQLERDHEAAVTGMPSGTYSLEMPGLGRYCYVRAIERNGAPVAERLIDLSENAARIAVILSGEAGSIAGRLETGGESSSGFAVLLAHLDLNDSQNTPSPELSYPDEEGRFMFDALTPGRYRLTAVPPQSSVSRHLVPFDVAVQPGRTAVVSLEASPAPAGGTGQGDKP